MIFKSFQIFLLLLLFGCKTDTSKESTLNVSIINEFKLDSSKVIYQFYQKFGFTDLCEDIRIVSSLESSPNLKNELPISIENLKIINSFSNKVDSFNGKEISIVPNLRNVFNDIELIYNEYITDSVFTISFNKGKYELTNYKFESTLKIYDEESGMFYLEIHRCDGL